MTTEATTAAADSASDSMAARLARQRQQRSMLRTSNLPLEEAAENTTPVVAGSELQVLRTEVGNSDATIARLQTQLKQSEAEMAEMGSKTARLAEELRLMREQADAKLAAAASSAPAAAGAGAAAPAAAPATAPAEAPPAAAADVSDPGPMQVSITGNAANPADGIQVHISIGTAPNGDAQVMVS